MVIKNRHWMNVTVWCFLWYLFACQANKYNMLPPLPIGSQSIRDVIKSGYYVDKTQYAQELLNQAAGKAIFLARPRQFGKSLFVSTLENIAKGEKELFKDCAIYKDDKYNWPKYPVVRLDFSGLSKKDLEQDIHHELARISREYKLEMPWQYDGGWKVSMQTHLKELIAKLIEKEGYENQVVVLIDEYDAPFVNELEAMSDEQQKEQETNCGIVTDFLTTLKVLGDHIKLEFVTGVSIFCLKNCRSSTNLRDITLNQDYATITGYRTEDLLNQDSLYPERIKAAAQHFGHTEDMTDTALADFVTLINTKYGGYKFSPLPNTDSVFHPGSVLGFLNECNFRNFWLSGGATPSFVIQSSRGLQIDWFQQEIVTTESELTYSTARDLTRVAELFQAGYLTIDRYKEQDPGNANRPLNEQKPLLVKFPNEEMQDAFEQVVQNKIKECARQTYQKIEEETYKPSGLTLSEQIIGALAQIDLESFKAIMNGHFGGIPYNLFWQSQNRNEAYYHSIMHTILNFSGMLTRSEQPTNRGRIDIVVDKLSNVTYVFELKHSKDTDPDVANRALDQIIGTNYMQPYFNKGKGIVAVGVHVSSAAECRNINNYQCAFYNQHGGQLEDRDAFLAYLKNVNNKNVNNNNVNNAEKTNNCPCKRVRGAG